MPIYNNLGLRHAIDNPRNCKGWDTRRVLLDGQLVAVCAGTSHPNLGDNKLRCVWDHEQEGDEDGQNLLHYLDGGDDHERQSRKELRELREVEKLGVRR
jgi:hypothetical protein